MRPLPILAALLCMITATYAGDGVAFTTVTSWSEALDLAKRSGKPIVLDAYTDWCGWCKVMDKETFANADVAKVMNAAFVNVKMDMERNGGVDVAMKYRITGFPTFMVFAADGTPTYKTFGYQAPEAWLKTLEAMQSPEQSMTFKGMAPGIDVPWPAWHRKSFLPGKLRTRPKPETVAEWFAAQEDKYSEVVFGVLLRHTLPTDLEDRILQNEQAYVDRFGDDALNLREGFIGSAFARACERNDTTLLQRAKDLVRIDDANRRAFIMLRLDGTYATRTKQWEWVGGVVQRLADMPDALEHADQVNEFCWTLYEQCSDTNVLAVATSAMERITHHADAPWGHVDTYAALLNKTGRKTEALQQAERAVRIGTAAGEDVSGTTTLIESIKVSK